jgi:hypothetical protein
MVCVTVSSLFSGDEAVCVALFFRARFKKELGFDGARKWKAELTLGNRKGRKRDVG